jgi:lipopolysaccharide transport system ATP-binding protein
LRDLIPALVRRMRPGSAEEPKLRDGDFWAVRDVSFEVRPGQALGIIGGNGAGKSTILKLLTKVLEPTRGHAELQGRVGALIEVSAGFHPDLTGRENVFLQGAIMGMPQRLIRERFDEIVEFSGVGPFIDTPVKRYSSGMNARLGFAIAVHLEPESLIIDEVLSVGDAEFQTRAFERIRALVQGNIPVVIVSHQLERIVELCSDCILLRQGQVVFHGTADEAVHRYLHGGTESASTLTDAPAGIRLLTLTGPSPAVVVSGETCQFRLEGEVTDAAPPKGIAIGITVVDAASNRQIFINNLYTVRAHPTAAGHFAASFQIQANVPAGLLRIETFLFDESVERVVSQGPAALFEVVPGIPFDGSHQLNIRSA